MATSYNLNDFVTFYVIINTFDKKSVIQAWTDDKELAEAYMKAHNCSHFKLKVLEGTWDEVAQLLYNENTNDELQFVNIITRDPKDSHELILQMMPMTETESSLIKGETQSFLGSLIKYNTINESLYYLKDKYYVALRAIHLVDILDTVINNGYHKKLERVGFDELKILFRLTYRNFD